MDINDVKEAVLHKCKHISLIKCRNICDDEYCRSHSHGSTSDSKKELYKLEKMVSKTMRIIAERNQYLHELTERVEQLESKLLKFSEV